MAKTSGSNRGGQSRIVGFSETEKAIQIEVRYAMEVAPQGGFVSSLVRDAHGTTKVWVPKSQIENGALSEYISRAKTDEVREKVLSRFNNGQVLHSDIIYKDASGKTIPVKATKQERQWAKERQKKRDAALKKATDRREELVKKAKENGYSAHMRMKTATLERMARGDYRSKSGKRR
jgi:hypothetical protein